ncbi:MAG: HAD-IA family hydrolase [Prevotella sp.]|nr:HAD-IA family hydrolase [Prevotella sp.]
MQEAFKQYLQRTAFGQCCPKAVLFDMDGVLINSMPNHAVAWQRSMATFNIHMTAADAYATEGARGIDTIRQMVKVQQGRDITLDEAQRMYDVKTRMFGEMPRAEVMAGAYELMEKIHRDGLTICVVTGSGQRPLIQRLTHDFAPFVDEQHIITAYDVTRGKPNPDPYLMGMERCGVEPWQTIVVENAPLGVRAGHAAKAFTIGVNTGPLEPQMLADAGADLVLGSMNELCQRWEEITL